MSKESGDGFDRPVGELWVELSRDEKKRICDALIDRNQPDVVQEFASLVRFTRGYLHTRPSGSERSSKDSRGTSFPSNQGAQPSSVGGNKRRNDEADLTDQREKKVQPIARAGPDRTSTWSGLSPTPQKLAAGEHVRTSSDDLSTVGVFGPRAAAHKSRPRLTMDDLRALSRKNATRFSI